jgi:anthranilate phosphoribosyltransferase
VRITRDLLAGKNGAPRAIVVLNVAATLVVGKLARNLREGVARAVEAIDSGAAARKLQELTAFTQRVKNAR